MDLDDHHLVELKVKAEDGDEKSQLLLGEHYLKLAATESNSGPSGRHAVDWLIKASRQGSEAATEHLKQCRLNGIGLYLKADLCINCAVVADFLKVLVHRLSDYLLIRLCKIFDSYLLSSSQTQDLWAISLLPPTEL